MNTLRLVFSVQSHEAFNQYHFQKKEKSKKKKKKKKEGIGSVFNFFFK